MPVGTIQIPQGQKTTLENLDSVMNDSWSIIGGSLIHQKNMLSQISKRIPSLKIGKYYRMRYEVYDFTDTAGACYVRLKVGNKNGILRQVNGITTDYFLVTSELEKTVTFVATGLLKIRNFYFEEKYISSENIPFSSPIHFQNKSFTRSYSFNSQSFIGHHSAIPDYYISQKNHLFSKYNNSGILYRHNQNGHYQTYKGLLKPFIVEYVGSSNPLATEVLEDISIQTRARRFDPTLQEYKDERNITFNKFLAYNTKQSTGEVIMANKESKGELQNWYKQQTVNIAATVTIARREKDWNINQIRDNVVNYDVPLFSTAWADVRAGYFTDKVVNPAAISLTKPWHSLESLRDKFAIIRLKFDTFNDVNLSMNFSLETEEPSIR